MRKILISLLLLSGLFSVQAEWQEMEIQQNESVWSSSSLSETLNGKTVTYGPEALFDGNFNTPWVEGVSGSGIGESITIQTNRGIEELSLVNGFALSERLFSRNNRIKAISISFLAGLTAPGLVTELDYSLYFTQELVHTDYLLLDDIRTLQSFMMEETVETQRDFLWEVVSQFSEDYPDFFQMILDDLDLTMFDFGDAMNLRLILEIYGFTGLKIEIRDIYPGTHYDDSCLSEIDLTLTDY